MYKFKSKFSTKNTSFVQNTLTVEMESFSDVVYLDKTDVRLFDHGSNVSSI